MNILEISPPVFKKTAGIERVVYELSRNFVKFGNKVFIITQKIEDPLKGVTFIFEKTSKKTIDKIKKEKGMDIVHSHGSESLFCDVLTMHSCHKAYVRSTNFIRKFSPRNWLTIFREKQAVKNAKKIVAVSKLVKKQLIREYRLEPEKIVVIYNGINLEEFYFKRNFKRLNEKEKINLLFVGNYFKRKGLKELLIALSKIKNNSFKLFIAGKDNPIPYIKLSQKLKIKEKIKFLGLVKNIQEIYKKSDIFIFPTKMEPYGLVELEAMASGLALVVSNSRYNGIAELLEDENNALLLDNPSDPNEIASKISLLLENRKLIKKFAQRGQKIALKLDWKNIAKKYLNTFEQIINQCD